MEYKIDNDTNYNETLNITCLYVVLANINTYFEYLCHIIHEIGKASYEGSLESSHPELRPLP